MPERPTGSLFGDNLSGWARKRMEQIHMGRVNPFMALVARLTADESCCSEKPSTRGAAAAAAGGSNSLTGTVLEHCRTPLFIWVYFIRLMRHNVPVECAAELCGDTTRPPSSGTTACSPRCTAAMTGSCCATPSGWTSLASATPTSPRATWAGAQARPNPPEAVHLRGYRRA